MPDDNKVTTGAQIPGRLFQLLNLHSLSTGQSKSQVIRDAILLWKEKNNITQDMLIKRLRQEFKTKWWRHVNRPEVSDTIEDKNAFIAEETEKLQASRVPESIINEIFLDF